MHDYLLSVISFVCICRAGLGANECQLAVLAQRRTVYVPKGGILDLSCEVQHCGHNWTGYWNWGNSIYASNTVNESQRHHLTSKTTSASQTMLLLNIRSVAQSDEGYYGCMAFWDSGASATGHLTHVNITTAVPSSRNLMHRVLIWAGAALCLPIILGLARCLSSEAKHQPHYSPQIIYEVAYAKPPTDSPPQPPPRSSLSQNRKTSPHKAPPKVPRKTDVVYAAISQDALEQKRTTRKPDQSATVYSSLTFNDGTMDMN